MCKIYDRRNLLFKLFAQNFIASKLNDFTVTVTKTFIILSQELCVLTEHTSYHTITCYLSWTTLVMYFNKLEIFCYLTIVYHSSTVFCVLKAMLLYLMLYDTCGWILSDLWNNNSPIIMHESSSILNFIFFHLKFECNLKRVTICNKFSQELSNLIY